MEEKLASFKKLLEIMDELRAKCPWDKSQTFETLRSLTIEETYELADAIIENNHDNIKKELGDLLLHIVFYAKVGSETNSFDIKSVTDGIIEKLIFRHPHIFGDVKVENANEVIKNWEQLKRKEGHKSTLEGVPLTLPAMVKAKRIQEKVAGVGFDWEEKSQVWDKVMEELKEVQVEIEQGNADKLEQEFGDLFFAVINASRLYGVDPESALERTNKKFIKRFQFLENETIAKGRSLHTMTLDEMNEIWERAKKEG